MKSILIFISCFLLVSCNYMSERKKHQYIIDSLSRIDVPKYFDTLLFQRQADCGILLDSITPEGIHIEQYQSYIYAYRMDVYYPDSLFRDTYEYDEKGRIVEYYQEIACPHGDGNAIGYRVTYDTLGNVCKYARDIPEVPFDIYDIIELLQKENVNIVDSSYVRYWDDWDGFSNFWHVTVYYNRYKYGHIRYFDPQTGKIIKEWTKQYK